MLTHPLYPLAYTPTVPTEPFPGIAGSAPTSAANGISALTPVHIGILPQSLKKRIARDKITEARRENNFPGNHLAYRGYKAVYGVDSRPQRKIRGLTAVRPREYIALLDLPALKGATEPDLDNIDFQDVDGNTYLMQLAGRDDPDNDEKLDLALKRYNANPNIRNNHNYTALHYAVAGKFSLRTEALLKNHADANVVGGLGQTPLHMAACNDDLGSMFALKHHGADLHRTDKDGNTALHLAIKYNMTKISLVYDPISIASSLEIYNHARRTPLLEALTDNRLAWAKDLVDNNADIEARDGNGRTALMLAIIANDKELVKQIIKKGPDIYAEDNRKETAIEQAWHNQRDDSFKRLMRYSLSPHAKREGALSPFMKALTDRKFILAADMLDYSVDVNQRNARGYTPLMLAVLHDEKELTEKLLRKQADINEKDPSANTALMLAVKYDKPQAFAALLEVPWDLDQANNHGQSALLLAAENGRMAMFDALMRLGADIDARDKNGLAAISLAINHNDTALLNNILSFHPVLNFADNDGNTLLMLAQQANNTYAQDILPQHGALWVLPTTLATSIPADELSSQPAAEDAAPMGQPPSPPVPTSTEGHDGAIGGPRMDSGVSSSNRPTHWMQRMTCWLGDLARTWGVSLPGMEKLLTVPVLRR
ncbi:ankyrin repeat domain-containing protein [Martelella alba]|uniref:Ankyrin repeat protein n=1 Tax=Martelella alba TaxID=2590451 RepID=A0ABY2SW67_9HYPH|nr:ankyrin repeat domain-containing protein [Martelella alba]TKI08782.1 hypothetical protein FCN80_01655 [Martelella alba]